MENAGTRWFIWTASVGVLALFCGYNLHTAVHRFDGIVGMTRKNGIGCKCHNIDPTPSVRVWIAGPDTLSPGESGVYTVSIAADSTRTAGFNIASAVGILTVVDSVHTYWYEDEMTHVTPRPADGMDSVSWQFGYVAPDHVDGMITDTLFSVGNSTNQDTMATDADHWNFGDDFLVTVMDVTDAKSEGGHGVPGRFAIHQNYPNPFNPTTTVVFDLPVNSSVTASLFDVAGRLVAILEKGFYPAGTHSLHIDAGRLTLSSGIYLCRLEAVSIHGKIAASTIKMALVK